MSNEQAITTDTSTDTTDRGTLVVLNRDLFFGVRIGNQLRALGYQVEFFANTGAFVGRLRQNPVSLAIVDIGAPPDWPLIQHFTADPAHETPVLAFGPHKDIEGMRAAKAAGVTRVVSNGDFHREMANLVARYARSVT